MDSSGISCWLVRESGQHLICHASSLCPKHNASPSYQISDDVNQNGDVLHKYINVKSITIGHIAVASSKTKKFVEKLHQSSCVVIARFTGPLGGNGLTTVNRGHGKSIIECWSYRQKAGWCRMGIGKMNWPRWVERKGKSRQGKSSVYSCICLLLLLFKLLHW